MRRHEPPEWRAVFEAWWQLMRPAFRVVRGAGRRVLGFSLVASAREVPPELARHDPLLCAWQADVEGGPGRERGALFMRRALFEASERLDARSAIWLDIKRAYVERPAQWAVYAAVRELDALLPLVARLGFPRSALAWQGERTLRLEFGPDGVWSWLRGLVNADLARAGAEVEPASLAPPERASRQPEPRWALDPAARGLVVDGVAQPLSALEYRALAFLLERAGQVVTRNELLDAVWQQQHTGSNVVDAVIRLLRKKLGPHASELETVRGHGYRVLRSG